MNLPASTALVSNWNRRAVAYLWVASALALLVAASLLISVAIGAIAPQRWQVIALAVFLPASMFMAIAFSWRWLRRESASGQADPNQDSNKPDSSERTLDQALGASHMKELRAQVDLLCAMATVERMGPTLTQELRNSGAATLAHQAAISAQMVHHILGAKNLAKQLHQNHIRLDVLALGALQKDLHAIAVALNRLGDVLRGDESTLPPLWNQVPEGGEVLANLEPIDQLLIQSTLLLSAVSDLARILATSYGKAKEEISRLAAKGASEGERGAGDLEAGEFGLDVPAWKLN